MLIDIGCVTSTAYVISNGDIAYSRIIPVGSIDIERYCANANGNAKEDQRINIDQIDLSLNSLRMNQSLGDSVRPLVSALTDGVNRIQQFLSGRIQGNRLNTLFIYGRGSTYAGLEETLTESMGQKVERIRKLSGVHFPDGLELAPYLNAIGALIRQKGRRDMYDLNFFSALNKQREKDRPTRVIGFSILVLIVILNALLFGFGYFAFRNLETRINNNKTFIDSPITKARVRDAEVMTREASVASEYLTIMQKTAAQISQTSVIKVELVDFIRGLAPPATTFISVQFDGINIDLNGVTSNAADPILYYHELLQQKRFSYVSLPEMTIDENNLIEFTINMMLKGVE